MERQAFTPKYLWALDERAAVRAMENAGVEPREAHVRVLRFLVTFARAGYRRAFGAFGHRNETQSRIAHFCRLSRQRVNEVLGDFAASGIVYMREQFCKVRRAGEELIRRVQNRIYFVWSGEMLQKLILAAVGERAWARAGGRRLRYTAPKRLSTLLSTGMSGNLYHKNDRVFIPLRSIGGWLQFAREAVLTRRVNAGLVA